MQAASFMLLTFVFRSEWHLPPLHPLAWFHCTIGSSYLAVWEAALWDHSLCNAVPWFQNGHQSLGSESVVPGRRINWESELCVSWVSHFIKFCQFSEMKTLWVQPCSGKRALRASQLPTRVLSCSFHSFPRRARHSLCWLLYLGMCGLSWGSIPDHSLTLSAIIYPHTEVLLITFILKSKQRAAFSGMGTCKSTLPSSDSMVPPYWSIHHTFYETKTLVPW